MLREFRVKNFALVDDLSICFGEGLNVITGETGSGKSVLVNALTVLLGNKSDSSMVRKGADSAVIEGIFDWTPCVEISSLMKDAGIPPGDDGELIVTREINAGGRSATRINSRTVAAGLLKEVGAALADIHGQHQHQALLRDANHTTFLDLLGNKKHEETLEEFRRRRAELLEMARVLYEAESGREKALEERDMLLFRVKEIEDAVDSEEALREMQDEAKRLENAGEITDAARAAWDEIARSGKDSSALNAIAAAVAALEPMSGIMQELDAARGMIEEAETILDEVGRDLRNIAESIEADPARLETLQDLILEIQALVKKNRCSSVAELLQFKESAKNRIKEIEETTLNTEKLEKDIAARKLELESIAARITVERTKVAAGLEKQMKGELGGLAMPDACFKVQFTCTVCDKGIPSPGGAESTEFLISANAGEDPMPLTKVASGGELSRIMLAFKSILSKHDPVSILVFDEIDTGIGGVTAHNIGDKLLTLGDHHQVITITHLPQIAALGKSHTAVSKAHSNGRTVVRAAAVDGDNRLAEICRMLGDSGTKNVTVEMARELMKKVAVKKAPPKKERKAAAK